MKKVMIMVSCLALFTLVRAPLSVAQEGGAAPAASYLIGAGDVLEVSVWKDAAQTKTVVVLPDGTISLPLIGQVDAAGKTVVQLKEEISAKIARFVPDPVLTVIVQQVNSLMVYVIGKVNNPGRFVLSGNINVLQALAMAGGLDQFARRDKITILREENGETAIFDFDYEAVSAGQKLGQNLRLRRGDVIVVP